MFFSRESLLDSLYQAKMQDPQFIDFCNTVKSDLATMEKDEVAMREWKIPIGLPRNLVLKQVKKQNYHRLRFTLIESHSQPNEKEGNKHERNGGGDGYILQVWDPRPNEYYRYGR